MQTFPSKFRWLRGLLIAALYVSVFGCATAPSTSPSVPAPAPVQPTAPVEPQPPVVTPVESETAPIVSPISPAPPATPTVPHIALLLPLNSPIFAKAADAVQQGFLSAAGKEVNGLPVRVYPCKDE